VTGAGAALVCSAGNGPCIDACTIGTVTELGVTDANNMGAAMAPAALQTIKAHFRDMNRSADDFDLIVTGDLGQVGKEALLALSRKEGISMGGKLVDCGCMVFDLQKQDVHAGGSGCGCSAITLCSDLLGKLSAGKLRRILFCGTGALLSPTSTQQGLAIPGVCHAVSITGGKTWSS
jgi:stage V sporulation protein AD